MVNDQHETIRIAGAAAGVTLWGVTLNEWVAIATLIYMVAQIFILMPKAVAIIKSWFNGPTE
jgi:hypothetical protein